MCIEEVQRRVVVVERDNARLKLVWGITVLVAVVFFVVGAAQDPRFQDTVTARIVAARSLNIVDANGNPRVVITENGISVGPPSDPVAFIRKHEGSALLSLFSGPGKPSVIIEATKSDGGILKAVGPNNKVRVVIGGNEDGGGIVIADKAGNAVASISVDKEGSGGLLVRDRHGGAKLVSPGP